MTALLPQEPPLTMALDDAPKAPLAARTRRERMWLMLRPVATALLIGIVLASAASAGVKLRRWVWDVTVPIRFGDIHNGCRWALLASGPEGYLNQYEKMRDEDSDWGVWLDYAPLRLYVMSRWGMWIRAHYPQLVGSDNWNWSHRPDEVWSNAQHLPNDAPHQRWDDPLFSDPHYAFTEPVLRFNMLMDGLAAMCAFFLTWLWVYRAATPAKVLPTLPRAGDPLRFLRGIWHGFAAALILWFNPAMLLSAHAWPTWDAWIVPFYLLAALLASLECWFFAGVALAIGAMFKGQQLTVAPIFLLWPIVQGRIGAALRWIAGFIFAFAGIASPWLVKYIPPTQWDTAQAAQARAMLPWEIRIRIFSAAQHVWDVPAVWWLSGVVAAVVVVPLALRWVPRRVTLPLETTRWFERIDRLMWLSRCSAVLIIAIVFAWPWFLRRNISAEFLHLHFPLLGFMLGLVLAIAALLLRPKNIGYLASGVLGSCLLLCIVLFHGSHSWWDCGFHFGTIHWPWMVMGLSSNLPGLLQERFGWAKDVNEYAMTLWGIRLTSKELLNGIYIIFLLISGIGLGLQAKRRDTRVLVALITPWVLMFSLPVQIHERYLLFAAGSAAICVGQSIGMALLGIFLSIVTWIMTIHVMLTAGDRGGFGQTLHAKLPSLCSKDAGVTLFHFVHNTHPDIGWAVLLCAAIFLYFSVVPGRRAAMRENADG